MPDPPADVTNVMLWRLAANVARHHQPDHTGRCAHPICRGAAWPCPPHHLAVRGDHAARRRPVTVAARVPATAVTAHTPPPVAYPRRTPSWVAVMATSGLRPQPGSDAATVLRLLQPGPATTETLAQNADLPPDRVAQALAALRHHGLAAPLTQALDRR